MNFRLRFFSLPILGALLLGGPCFGEVTQKHRELAKSVLSRLLEKMERPDGYSQWPPTIEVTDHDHANAFASVKGDGDGNWVPHIEVTQGEIKAANFDPHVLAFTIGHELGHLWHRHSLKSIQRREELGAPTELVRIAVKREAELEADLFGRDLALKAEFSPLGIKNNLKTSSSGPGQQYCVFEALNVDHPSWDERIAFLAKDEHQSRLWRSTSAFRNGVLFLETEQFEHAEFCFRRVTKEFPNCYEAWANLGYALLMRYCDALEPDDLRSLDLGHLVLGGFYRRPDSLAAQVRGSDEDLWFEAVGALREALRLKERLELKDDLILVKANLAVAYLVHPAGKNVREAERLFGEVFATLQDEARAAKIDPFIRAAILINAGAGRTGEPTELLQKATRTIAGLQNDRPDSRAVQTLEAALNYNQAKALVISTREDDRRSALKLYENYLGRMDPASAWWPLAKEEYLKLAGALGTEPIAPEKMARRRANSWRPITIVKLADGLQVALSEPIAEVTERLGEPDVIVSVIKGTNMRLYRYEGRGVTILATREVLAIFVRGAAAPTVALQRPDLGSQPEQLSVGMSQARLEQLLGGEWDCDATALYDPSVAHHLYRNAGVAVRFHSGKVSELVVVVVPRAESTKP